jgi:hypothetical protein
MNSTDTAHGKADTGTAKGLASPDILVLVTGYQHFLMWMKVLVFCSKMATQDT